MPSSGSSTPTQQNVTQTSIPQQFYPYLQNIMGSAQGIASNPYQPYTGARLSNFSTDTQQAFDAQRNSFGAWQPYNQTATNGMGTAMNSTQNSIGQLQGLGSGQNIPQVSTGQWGNQAASQYMSPYLNQVMGAQAAQMNDQRLTQDAAIAGNAEQAGAYGGGRFAVQQAMNDKNYNQQLQAMQANTLNNAYTNAQQTFATDQSRGLQAQTANQSANIQGQNLALQNQQMQLGAANQLGSLSNAMSGLGTNYQTLNNNDINALRNQGLQQEQLNQASLDLGYQNFQNQQNWAPSQLAFESGILHGLPVGGTVTSTSSQNINPFSQMMGAGLGLSGLYQNLTGGSGASGTA